MRKSQDYMLPGSRLVKRASSLIIGLCEVCRSSPPPSLSFHSSYQLLSTMEQRHKRGAFIVFEGLDRSGKTTQVSRLLQTLEQTKEKYPFRGMRFPDRTPTNPINVEICDYLSKKKDLPAKDAHLLFTKQRQNQKSEMERFVQQGTSLIVDRYSHSGAAYSAAKGLPLDWCMAQEEGLLKPDLVVFLDLFADVVRNRSGFGEERFEEEPFQKSVYEQYMKLQDETWLRVNASGTEDEIAAEVQQAVFRIIEDCREKPIQHFGGKQEEVNQPQMALPRRQCTPTKAQQSSKEPTASLVGCEVK